MAVSGRRLSRGEGGNPLGRATSGQLGEANVQDRAFGVGKVTAGGGVGKAKAVYAQRVTAGASGTVFILDHDLKEIPSLIEQVGARGNANPITSQGVETEKWTPTSARVKVWTSAGTLDGVVVMFRVSGR